MKRTLLAFLALTALIAPSVAQTKYPDHTVRIIVPTAAGGSIDATARIVAEKLSAKWGQPVIIENKPGAGMRIGADYAAKSAPDGYTFLVAHDGTMAMNPVAYPDLPYNPQKDFVPLGMLSSIPEVIMVNANFPAKTLQELIDYAKKNPGKLNHATGGTATMLALELFKAMAGVEIANVSYRGGLPAVTGLMGGDVEVCIADIATASAGLQSDKVRPLAITTLKRVKQFPDLPTADEAGVKGYDVATWVGAFAPAGTPKEIVAKIEAGLKDALSAPDVRTKLEAIGMEIRSGTGEEMRIVLAEDTSKWAKLVKEQNIKIAQ